MICARTPVSNICFDVSAFRNEFASANGESESSPVNAHHKSAWERHHKATSADGASVSEWYGLARASKIRTVPQGLMRTKLCLSLVAFG
jgi:hypothetical protein